MDRMKRLFLLSVVVLLGLPQSVRAQVDSLDLSYTDYLGLVLQNHPMAQQAELRGQSGEQYIRVARGAFDPYLAANWDAKQFSGKDYWQIFQSSVRVPTWFGTEIFAGWNSANGTNLDPSQSIPLSGQAVLGVEVNVGRGLFIDQRRADLQKAKLYAQGTLVEQRIMVLDLINAATTAYWDWWLASTNKHTYTDVMRLAQLRYSAVVGSWERGENPAIDTLEAYLQVQMRLLNLSEAEADLIKAEQNLNTFLWNPEGEPVEFEQPLRPAPLNSQPFRVPELSGSQIDSMLAAHPDLLYYRLRQAQLEVERRLQKEQLKPEIAVKYQALSAAAGNGEWIGTISPADNLKWGVKFSFPLFLRKQRGYLELNKLALQEIDLAQDQKALELRNKLEALIGTISQTQTQILLSRAMVTNYLELVNAETIRFEAGESSVFLVNAREQRLVEAELKLNALQAKLPILLGETNRVTGGYLIGDPSTEE
jgi:outer membrane protein TolC